MYICISEIVLFVGGGWRSLESPGGLEAKFVKEFSGATIKGWKGLKLSYLEDLMLVDLKGQDVSKEMNYSEDNAQVLVENSQEFDNWLNEVVFDLQHFRGGSEGKAVSKAESPSG